MAAAVQEIGEALQSLTVPTAAQAMTGLAAGGAARPCSLPVPAGAAWHGSTTAGQGPLTPPQAECCSVVARGKGSS